MHDLVNQGSNSVSAGCRLIEDTFNLRSVAEPRSGSRGVDQQLPREVAGNLALTIGARGGVYLAGGILPKIQPLFMKSGFRARFEAKGRYEKYMAPIPTWLVTHPNPAYLGLMAMLENSNG